MTISFTAALIVYSAITIIPIVAITWLMKKYRDVLDISLHIDKETMFYFKSNPSITCIILDILYDTSEKPNLKLIVTYTDGSMGELITPMSEFKNLWIEC